MDDKSDWNYADKTLKLYKSWPYLNWNQLIAYPIKLRFIGLVKFSIKIRLELWWAAKITLNILCARCFRVFTSVGENFLPVPSQSWLRFRQAIGTRAGFVFLSDSRWWNVLLIEMLWHFAVFNWTEKNWTAIMVGYYNQGKVFLLQLSILMIRFFEFIFSMFIFVMSGREFGIFSNKYLNLYQMWRLNKWYISSSP